MKKWLRDMFYLLPKKIWHQLKHLYYQLLAAKERRNQQKDALSFLPSALEIAERPPHPAARLIMWLLVGFIILLLFWACFGKMDIVVVANGKLEPQAQVKEIQPLEKGAIKAILVKDGQLVEKGQLLIKLDQRVTQTDIDNLQHQFKVARFMLAQNKVLYHLLDLPQNISLDSATIAKMLDDKRLDDKGFSEGERKTLIELILRKWQAYTAQINYLNTTIDAVRAEKSAVEAQMQMLTKTLPLIKAQNHMYETLHQSEYVSKMEWLRSQRELIEKEQAITQLQAIIAQSKSNVASQTSALNRTKADYLAQILENIETSNKEVNVLEKVMEKYRLVQEAQTLISPITGFVQGLAVHTVGAIVTEAQVLMRIVPKDSPLEVNAHISNKDIGYVHEGQTVRVKVDTYPFTEYGFLTGKVLELSDDAIEDEKLGMIFKTTIALDGETLHKAGKTFYIRSGMTVTVEVKTDERRIIDYFLSPLSKALSESLHER